MERKVPWEMPRLWEACVEVLEEERRPLHYADLTVAALAKIGMRDLPPPQHRRVIEDVREKLLLARQHGTFYVGKPHCVGALQEWFLTDQPVLFGGCDLFVPANIQYCINASTDALLRQPYMIRKVANSDDYRRYASMFGGKIIEEHVSRWFKGHWPEFWQRPDNFGLYDRPCNHDFKLKEPRCLHEVDVVGPRYGGGFVLPGGGKLSADIHILASYQEASVIIHGFFWRAQIDRFYSEVRPGDDVSLPVDASNSIMRLVVRLNCHKHGLDYDLIRKVAGRRRLSCA